MSDGQAPKIFISYSHLDKRWLERLEMHLKLLVNMPEIDLWNDTRLKAGDRWRQEIRDAIATPKVANLLVSANFNHHSSLQVTNYQLSSTPMEQ